MTDIVTREEREELRRAWEEFGRSRYGDRVAEQRFLMKAHDSLPRLLDTIDAKDAEIERLRKPRCIGCGRTEDELHVPGCSHINGRSAGQEGGE